MSVRSLVDYDHSPKDSKDKFGDDMLVHVLWEGNMTIPVPGVFRVPHAMPWENFKAQVLDPWAGWDPGYDAVAATGWKLDETPFDPQAGQTLADLGVDHKGLIRFHT